MKKFNSVSLDYIGGSYVLDVYGEPSNVWFKAVDVAEMLDYSKTQNGYYKLDGLTACLEDSEISSSNSVGTTSKGGQESNLFISENGLYRILLTSRKPFAKQVQSTVFQYLREIRKHGVTGTSERLTELANNPDLLIELANKIKEERARADAEKERADKAEETIKEMEDRDVKTIINDLNKKYEPKKIHKLTYSLLREHKVWDGMEINKAYSELFETYNNQNGIRSIAYKSEKREEVKKLIDDWLTLHFAKEEIKKMILFDKES